MDVGSESEMSELPLQLDYSLWQHLFHDYRGKGPARLFYSMVEPVVVENTYNFETPYVSAAVGAVGMLPAVNSLRAEIAGVREDLARQKEIFERKLEQILLAVQHGNIAEIEFEDVDDSQARARILALFKESGVSLFYDQIAEQLKLPLRQTVEICNQLEAEGLIGEPTTER